MARPKGTPKTGGRKPGTPNKATADIKALAQVHGEQAIGTLAGMIGDTSLPPAARVAAAKELLDRGYGKAGQSVELSATDGKSMALVVQFD